MKRLIKKKDVFYLSCIAIILTFNLANLIIINHFNEQDFHKKKPLCLWLLVPDRLGLRIKIKYVKIVSYLSLCKLFSITLNDDNDS